MSGNNDVDLFITLHATFNGDYLQQPFHQLLDVPPDPGPPRTNTAVLPVEATFGGTRIRINQDTYLQISTVGNVDLNRVDNHITVHPPRAPRPTSYLDRIENRGIFSQQRYLDQIMHNDRNVVRQHVNNMFAPEYRVAGVHYAPVAQPQYNLFPPIVEMRNMNINRRPNDHDRLEVDSVPQQQRR